MKRWALAFVAWFLLGGAIITAPGKQPEEANAEQGQANAERSAPPLVIKVVPVPKSAAEAQEEKRDNQRKADIEGKALVTNFALALFAFLQVVVTGITLFGLRHAKVAAEAADKAADAAKASIDHLASIERAYVFGGIVDIKFDPKAGTTAFDFIVQNSGRTPARVREAHIGIVPLVAGQPWPDKPDYSATMTYETDTIFEAGGKSVQIDFHDQPPFGVVYGYLLYSDIFKKPHYSRFCMAYDGREGRASTHGNDAWNEYD